MYNIYICYLKGTDGVRGELCVNKELDGWHKVGVGGTRWEQLTRREQRNHGSSGVVGWDSGAKKHFWTWTQMRAYHFEMATSLTFYTE